MYLLEVGFEESMPHSPFRLVPALLNHSYHRHTWPASVPVILNQGTSFFFFFLFSFFFQEFRPSKWGRHPGGQYENRRRSTSRSTARRWQFGLREMEKVRGEDGEAFEDEDPCLPFEPPPSHEVSRELAGNEINISSRRTSSGWCCRRTRIYICMHAHHPAVAAASPPAGSCMN